MAGDKTLAIQLEDDLWLLDTMFRGERGVIASYLLTGEHEIALVDVGSAASLETLLDAVRAAGVAPEAITHLLLTHVHLDHAGASGALVRRLPHARVFVHRIGAPHLLDPSRLVRSAARIYGERMYELWGNMEPVPTGRLSELDDGDEVRIGERVLRVLYTPGHAIHHVAYFDARRRAVFAGDVAGVRLQDIEYVRPPTPPPDLNLEDWYASIERLERLDPSVLYLAHFGPSRQTASHLNGLRRSLAQWGKLLLPGIRAQASDEALERLLADTFDPEIARRAPVEGASAVRRYEIATNYLMSGQGYRRYYQKYHPELLTAEGSQP